MLSNRVGQLEAQTEELRQEIIAATMHTPFKVAQSSGLGPEDSTGAAAQLSVMQHDLEATKSKVCGCSLLVWRGKWVMQVWLAGQIHGGWVVLRV